MTDFDRAFEKTLRFEGGGELVDDPNDAGGPTRWGISQRAYPDLDIKNLTKEGAKEIYRKDYWLKIWPNDDDHETDPEDEIYLRMGWKLYDIAVNQGVPTALKFKDKVNGIGSLYVLSELCELQMKRYVEITVNRPQNLTFLKGWCRRAFDKGNDL